MEVNKMARVDFDALNKATREWNHRNVDRFNESTKSNYRYFDPCALNNQAYKTNNGQYSNYYTYKGGK